MKKIFSQIYTGLFTVCLFLLCGFIAIMIPANSRDFYKWQFEKNDTVALVRSQYVYLDGEGRDYIENITEEQTLDLMQHVMRYCLFLEDDMNITVDGQYLELFTENELSHMKDVRGVFGGGLIIVLISFIVVVAGIVLAIIFRKGYWENCRKIPYYVFGGIIALFALLAILIACDFQKAFQIFHMIFFTGNWTFSNGVMISMIGYIFTDIVWIIALGWVFFTAISITIVAIYNKLIKNALISKQTD